ncbi:TolB family protein [Rhodanobacter sp. Col0626]|uniref:TolB family protein n=1 Tax=Rhodanobacter sp. Col0626 TaxID=3415679 RepID=UPI003CF2AAF4
MLPGILLQMALAAASSPALSAHSPPQRWAPGAISSNQFESHPAFDPLIDDLYFVRSSPAFSGWRILTSHCGPTGWTAPHDAPFAGDGVEADPWFTPDGHSLYFISTRSTDGIKRKDLDIWRVERTDATHWGKPERLPSPVSSTGNEWFPRLARDGWLYFGSDRPGGFGKTDIWRARPDSHGVWHVENAGPALNTAGDEYEPLPSPDGRTLIVMADGGLYMSQLHHHAWTPRTKLDQAINVTGSEIGALWSPSGRSLMFARDLKGSLSGELFVTHFGATEAWPTACPRAMEITPK